MTPAAATVTPTRAPTWLFTLVLVSLCAAGCRRSKDEQPPTAFDQQKQSTPAKLPTFELWYLIQADGQPIGYRHVTLRAPLAAGPPTLELVSDQQTRITAGGPTADQRMKLTERCTTDGALLMLTVERRSAKGALRRQFLVQGRNLQIVDPDSSASRTTLLPAGPPISGLCALYLALLRQSDGQTLRTLDSKTGAVISGQLLRVPGATDRYRYSDSSLTGGRTELLLGPDRLPVRLTISGLATELQLTLSTRAEAERVLTRKQPTDPQDPGNTLAVSPINLGARIPEPLDAQRIRYSLTLAADLPQSVLAELGRDNQRRLASTTRSPVIEVQRPGPLTPLHAALPFPPPQARLHAARSYLLHPAPSLPERDPRRTHIAALTRGSQTTLQAALRINAWSAVVPSSGFPDRAALLVAALKSVGIPARLAFGFLYVGSVMTSHTWAEAFVGTWLPLDPETGGAVGATHLRLLTSPATATRDPRADWRLLTPRLRTLRARLLEATLASGFQFVPGAAVNTQQTGNVLYQRVWNLVVRRPLAARFVAPGAADPFDLAVVSTDAALRLELQLFAANAAGLTPKTFLAMGYRPRRIGQRDYLVRVRKKIGDKKKNGDNAETRSYVQLSCSPKPWAARLVRWTMTGPGLTPRLITEYETKVLGTFQMTGHPAGTQSCAKPGNN